MPCEFVKAAVRRPMQALPLPACGERAPSLTLPRLRGREGWGLAAERAGVRGKASGNRRAPAEIGANDLVVLPHLGGRALGDLLAVIEDDNAIGEIDHDIELVLYQHDRQAEPVEALDLVGQFQR